MEEIGKEVVDFDQLVRIFVDTDVDTHFIVSLSRTSTVAELRELVKVTHRHCYPDGGDVDIGKLAVPGGDYGYHLADFLLIGQVYDRYEGKVFAEVKNHEPASNSSQGLFRMPDLSFKTNSTQKKVPLLAPQPFEHVAGQISTNASGFVPLSDPGVCVGEPRALLPVGSNPCEPRIELIVPKLQKEEINEDGTCFLGSQEPLDGLPSRPRGFLVGSFQRIVEEEDEKLVETPSTAINDGGSEVSGSHLVPKLDQLNPDMCSVDLHVKPDKISLGATHAVSSDIQGVRRKRDASESNDRPSKSWRLTEEALSGNTSKPPLENGRCETRNVAIERSKDDCSNLDGMNNVFKDVNAVASSSHMNRSGDLDAKYLSSSGSKRRKKKALHICDLTIIENGSEAVKDVMLGVENKEEMCNDEIRKKERQGGIDLVTGSGVEGIGNNGLKVGREEKSFSLPEDDGVPPASDQKGKQKRKPKQEKKQEKEKEREQEKEPEQEETEKLEKKEKEPEQEKTEKMEKKVRKQKQKEPEQEKQPEHEKARKKGKKQKQKEPEQEKQPEHEKTEKKEKKQKQKEPEQEKQPAQEKMEKTEKKEKGKNEKKQKKEKKQKQIIDENTPLDCASLNPLLEESDKEPEQENDHLGAPAISPKLSQHVDNDEKDSADDVPDVKISEGLKKKGSTAAAAVAYDFRSLMGDEDSGRPSASNFLKDEISESGTPQREAQVSGDTSGGGMTRNAAMATGLVNIDDNVLPRKENLFGDVDDVETSPSYQGGTETSPQTQGTKVGSVESQETPNPSKHVSCTRAGRGAPSQTRSIESSRDVTKGKQIGGRDTKTNESQSSQFSEKATQQSEGINLGSEVSGAWLLRGRLENEPGYIGQLEVANTGKAAHSRSCTGESSAESDPRFADQTEVRSHQDLSRKEGQMPEALHTNHTSRTVKSPEKHDSTSVKRSDGGEVSIKNDSLEFFSQDQSFHVAPTQIEKALSGSTTEDSSDESDADPVEGTDMLKKQTAGNLDITHKGGRESKESSDESGGLVTPGRRGFPSLTTRAPVPSVSRMTGNGGSQSFKRRASGVAAEIEAKFAQFIESQGGLDEIMGITLGQRKRSMPVESSTQVGLGARSVGSLATPFGSPLDLALNTQESVKNSPIVLDIVQASQNSAGIYFTPQFKVPKPIPFEPISGGVQGVFNSAATTVPSTGREVPKVRTAKELRLKRKESTPQVDKNKGTDSLLLNHNNACPLPALESSKETFLEDRDAAKGKPKLSPPETPKSTFLDDLNVAEMRKSSVGKSSEKKKRLEEKHQDSQFMIVNNTDHILELERKDKTPESEDGTKGPSGVNEDGSLVSPKKSGKKSKEGKVKIESVETGVLGSPDMFVLDTSGKKKKRTKSEKEGPRKKRTKFLPEELDGKEVTILPENSVERSARETEELYFKLEKANRDLWLQNKSVSSFRKEEAKIGNRDYPAADFHDTEGADGEDVAQSRLVGRESEIGDSGSDKLKVVGDTPVHGNDAADRDPSPELCAGTTEASDREDSVFQSQDEKAETSQQDKFKPTDIFDYVSGDELPTKVLSKSAKRSETNEKRIAKRMEELSGRAVQRVLDDEMLHVVDTNDVPGKKSRKDAKPVKWTVRMRGLSPSALATSLHGGTVLSDATGGASGEGGAQVKREVADIKPRRVAKAPPKVPKLKQSGTEMCPVGCGKAYSAKTSAYYLHKAKCTGAPPDK